MSNYKIFRFLLLPLIAGIAFGFACTERGEAQSESKKLIARIELAPVDSLFDLLEGNVQKTPDKLAEFRDAREETTSLLTGDGTDFSRSIGLRIESDENDLIPTWYYPIKERCNRLNNIALLQQIWLPVQDEYGPTKQYQVRQDISFSQGLPLFFWPIEPLLAQEGEGWIWVSTDKGLSQITDSFDPSWNRAGEQNDSSLVPQEGMILQGELFPDRLNRTQRTLALTAGRLLIFFLQSNQSDNRVAMLQNAIAPISLYDLNRVVERLVIDTQSLQFALYHDKNTDELVFQVDWKIQEKSQSQLLLTRNDVRDRMDIAIDNFISMLETHLATGSTFRHQLEIEPLRLQLSFRTDFAPIADILATYCR